MQETLVIYLQSADLLHLGWAVIREDGTISQHAHQDNPEGLANIADGKNVVVIVPAQDVLLVTATLPKMSRSRLMEALPFALEEQLIADVDTSHFVPLEQQADGTLTVMVVAHEKMSQWINTLTAWQIKPDALYPLFAAIPVTENQWHVAISDVAVVRTQINQAYACDKANLNVILDLTATAATTLPNAIILHNYTQSPYTQLIDLPATIKETFIEKERLVSDLALQLKQANQFNLLQGRYATKKSKLPHMGKMWKLAAYFASAWVALLFLSPIISDLILWRRAASIDTQIVQIYKRHFPGSTSIVAPKLRMEEKLQKLTAQTGASRVLMLLAQVGKGMLETPSIKLKRFDFQDGVLTLELTAASSDDFAAFTDYLAQQGLGVKQQSANLTGERINATVEIEG